MAEFTKEDFDTQYRIQVERRMPGGGPPPAEGRPPVYAHYHKILMVPILNQMWANIQPVLNIGPEEFVCVVGAGFGWGVEALIAETGATAVGIDISQYIADEQGNTEEAELREHIQTAGLDPDTGRGAEVLAFVSDGLPRANVIVLQEDAQTNGSRQAIRAALGGNWPSVVVYENIIDDTWTDEEIVSARNAGNGFGGHQRLIWVYKQTANRSYQDLFDLLPPSNAPSEVISTDGTIYLT